MRRIIRILLALALLAALTTGAVADTAPICIGGLDNDIWFTKYGNVNTNCSGETFFGDMGFAWGDMVKVSFLDRELILPVVPDYSYVESGMPAIVVRQDERGKVDENVTLAINMGSFAETYGLGKKQTEENHWYWESEVTFPVAVEFEMAEKEGYLTQYLLHRMGRTNEREDYAQLTDGEFANFRPILLGKLYRTSSPINPELGRNTYAQIEMAKAGVTVVMNLADSQETAAGYPGFENSYYSKQKVIYLDLGVDVTEKSFRDGLAKGLAFFAENNGVYAVHCTEGKDRAGFVSALLECFVGASYDGIVADYMTTYKNYYGVEKDTEQYDAIAQSNIVKTLENAFGVDDLKQANLAAEAEEYMKEIGLTEEQIQQLKVNLGIQEEDKMMYVWASVSVAALAVVFIIIDKKRGHRK